MGMFSRRKDDRSVDSLVAEANAAGPTLAGPVAGPIATGGFRLTV